MKTLRVDGHLVAQQRAALRLDRSELATRCGVSLAQMRTVEDEKHSHDGLTLSFVARLAHELGVDPTTLLRPGTYDAEKVPDDARAGGKRDPAEPDRVVAADADALEAALAAADVELRIEDIARALGWTIERLADARGTLTARLEDSAWRLGGSAGKLRLLPRMERLEGADHVRLARIELREPLWLTQATLILRLVMEGELDNRWLHGQNKHARVTLGKLARARLILRRGGGWQLAPEVERSLAGGAVSTAGRTREEPN